jgi:DNA-binding response OmpR family regulator
MDIFVVDDERLIAETLALILQTRGYSVQSFHSAEAALKALHLTPKLLVTDYSMPDLSGTDLVLAVRKALPECPAILFSAELEDSHPDWRQLVLAHTPTVLLQKPLRPAELFHCVECCLSSCVTVAVTKTRSAMAESRDEVSQQVDQTNAEESFPADSYRHASLHPKG